jgi:type I restriction enzyme S subunit
VSKQRPLRAFVEVTLGRQRAPQYETGPFMVPYLRAANVQDGTLDLSDVKLMNFSPDEQKLFALRRGDVLVTEGSGSLEAVGASATWLEDIPSTVCFQNTLLRLRPRSNSTDSRFLAWWARHAFTSGAFASIAIGANILHLSVERLRCLPAWFPSIDVQREIAGYLVDETKRIDLLIAAKHHMVTLVRERFDAVARQILDNPNWPTLPLKRRWKVIDCRHRTPLYMNEGFPVVSPGDATPGRLDLSRCHRFVAKSDFEDLTAGGRRPKLGDLIFSRNASVGIASYVDTDRPFCMGQDVCLITSEDQDQRFLTYYLNTLGSDKLKPELVGSTFTRVNVDQLVELRVPAPEKEEQRSIANRMDELAGRTDAIIGELRRQTVLLQEHRRAFISSMMTGQIDVATARGGST